MEEEMYSTVLVTSGCVPIYIRNSRKQAIMIKTSYLVDPVKLTEVVTSRFKIPQSQQILYYDGQQVYPSDSKQMQMAPESIVHLIDLRNIKDKISIRVRKNNSSKAYLYTVDSNMKIEGFFAQFMDRAERDKFFLVYASKQLKRNNTFRQENVEDNSELFCLHEDKDAIQATANAKQPRSLKEIVSEGIMLRSAIVDSSRNYNDQPFFRSKKEASIHCIPAPIQTPEETILLRKNNIIKMEQKEQNQQDDNQIRENYVKEVKCNLREEESQEQILDQSIQQQKIISVAKKIQNSCAEIQIQQQNKAQVFRDSKTVLEISEQRNQKQQKQQQAIEKINDIESGLQRSLSESPTVQILTNGQLTREQVGTMFNEESISSIMDHSHNPENQRKSEDNNLFNTVIIGFADNSQANSLSQELSFDHDTRDNREQGGRVLPHSIIQEEKEEQSILEITQKDKSMLEASFKSQLSSQHQNLLLQTNQPPLHQQQITAELSSKNEINKNQQTNKQQHIQLQEKQQQKQNAEEDEIEIVSQSMLLQQEESVKEVCRKSVKSMNASIVERLCQQNSEYSKEEMQNDHSHSEQDIIMCDDQMKDNQNQSEDNEFVNSQSSKLKRIKSSIIQKYDLDLKAGDLVYSCQIKSLNPIDLRTKIIGRTIIPQDIILQ